LLKGGAAIRISGARRGPASAVIKDQAGDHQYEQYAGDEAAEAEFESRFKDAEHCSSMMAERPPPLNRCADGPQVTSQACEVG
jgi:hypothetical protein